MKKEKEHWAMIKGYEFLYWVSSWARIKNQYGLIRKTPISHGGYRIIDLHKYGRRKTCRVNRLVATAFVPNPDNKPYVNHKDCNKTNDYYKNLEWSTQQENVAHAVKNGRIKVGENSPYAKLTNAQVVEIFNSNDAPKVIAGTYGISRSHVSSIKTGEKWSHITRKKHVKERVLTEEEILDIFNSTETQAVIAERHSIQTLVVSSIKTGRCWGSVTGKKYSPIPDKRLYKGRMMSVKQICDYEGLKYWSVLGRTWKGDTLEQAIAKQHQYQKTGVRQESERHKRKQKTLEIEYQ